ncbi:YibE/F family protein [Clostridiales bacterium COT073_COT-073]|nr:YibE/F family protein [Clostridiales bacterium COT073_COT-073]
MRTRKENAKEIYHFILIVAAILAIIIMAAVSPLLKEGLPKPDYYNQDFEDAKVLRVIQEDIQQDGVIEGFFTGKQTLEVEVLSGKYQGLIQETVNVIDLSHTVYATEGMEVIVGIREAEEGPKVWVYNHKRKNYLYVLAALFFLLLIFFGRKKGVYAIIALLFTTAILLFALVPLIFRGYSTVLVSSVCAILALVVSFLVIGGFEKKTLVAILGTICGILAAGLVSFVFSSLTRVSVVNLEKGSQIVYMALDYKIKVKGIMYASILIASLGAIMDVAMSISSSMQEIYELNPAISFQELFKRGMNIGRDIMGTMANTLILAFMGGSFSLVMLLWGYNMTLRQISNLPFIAVEVVQGLSGSIGIVLTVPFTAFMACLLYLRHRQGKIKKVN